jgi:hypothetical protein
MKVVIMNSAPDPKTRGTILVFAIVLPLCAHPIASQHVSQTRAAHHLGEQDVVGPATDTVFAVPTGGSSDASVVRPAEYIIGAIPLKRPPSGSATARQSVEYMIGGKKANAQMPT